MLLFEGEKSSHRTSSTDNPPWCASMHARTPLMLLRLWTSLKETKEQYTSTNSDTSIALDWEASAWMALRHYNCCCSGSWSVPYQHPNRQSALTKGVVANAYLQSSSVASESDEAQCTVHTLLHYRRPFVVLCWLLYSSPRPSAHVLSPIWSVFNFPFPRVRCVVILDSVNVYSTHSTCTVE